MVLGLMEREPHRVVSPPPKLCEVKKSKLPTKLAKQVEHLDNYLKSVKVYRLQDLMDFAPRNLKSLVQTQKVDTSII